MASNMEFLWSSGVWGAEQMFAHKHLETKKLS